MPEKMEQPKQYTPERGEDKRILLELLTRKEDQLSVDIKGNKGILVPNGYISVDLGKDVGFDQDGDAVKEWGIVVSNNGSTSPAVSVKRYTVDGNNVNSEFIKIDLPETIREMIDICEQIILSPMQHTTAEKLIELVNNGDLKIIDRNSAVE